MNELDISPPTLFDYVKPCYIQNLERDNLISSATGQTRWHVTAHDTTGYTITVDQDLPEELSEASTEFNKRWFLTNAPGTWAYISDVDFLNRRITYSQIRSSITVGMHATWNNPFRSFSLNPISLIIDTTAWASLWIIPGPVWKHSDGTYRLVSVGYNSSYNTTTLYSSSDLETWTLSGASYMYRAGVHPFDESWCVGAVNHNTYGNMAKIKDGVYAGNYLSMVQGLNSSGEMHCAAVIFDENFNVVYMPSSPIIIPGYLVDASDKYNIGTGTFYYKNKLYAQISYRHLTPDNIYKTLLCELSGPIDPTVLNIEEIQSGTLPNTFCSASAPGGAIFEYNGQLYSFLAGESQFAVGDSVTDTPLFRNFEGGILYKDKGVWTLHKDSPLLMNPVSMTEVYSDTTWTSDAMGVIGSTWYENDILYIFAAGKASADTYRIGRYTINLAKTPTLNLSPPTLFDYIKPCYIQNLERDNLNPVTSTRWHVTAHDTTGYTITFDQDLPAELVEAGTDWRNRWIIQGVPGNLAYISNVDFPNKRISYSYLRGTISVNNHMSFMNPLRSFNLEPQSVMIDVNTWCTTFMNPGPTWKHSDGTYRMVAIGWNGTNQTSAVCSSSDLKTWTYLTSNYKYTGGVHPFDEVWSTSTVAHYAGGQMALIRDGIYAGNYLCGVQGWTAAGYRNIGMVIFDENFDVVYMPTAAITIPGYEITASDIYHYPCGTFYHNNKLYMSVSYRDITPDNFYELILCELSGPVNPTVVSVEVILPQQIPNSFCGTSAPTGSFFEYNGQLYCFVVGESATANSPTLTDTPLINLFCTGIMYKDNGVWTMHKESPLMMSFVVGDGVWTGQTWCDRGMGILNLFYENGVLNVMGSMKHATDAYKIGRWTLDLPITPRIKLSKRRFPFMGIGTWNQSSTSNPVYSINGGASWNNFNTTGMTTTVRGFCYTAPYFNTVSSNQKDIVVASYSGSTSRLWTSHDYGNSWIYTSFTGCTLDFVSTTPNNQTWYAGGWTYQNMQKSTDNGNTWSKLTMPTNEIVVNFVGSESGQYVYGSTQAISSIMVSSDYGVNFTRNTLTGSGNHSSVNCSKTGQYVVAYYGANNLGIHLSTDYGSNFNRINANDGMMGLWNDASMIFYVDVVAGGSGFCYSIDYGSSWTSVALPGGWTSNVSMIYSNYQKKIYIWKAQADTELYVLNDAKNGWDLVYNSPVNIWLVVPSNFNNNVMISNLVDYKVYLLNYKKPATIKLIYTGDGAYPMPQML